ncbi:MAG: flippase-like domain-containing protein [Ignavibacteriales bacterium]|nr:flippase-like domain-containing protein [Ignavibacteriales bacterium]MCF8316472.1 flippase-like domain-containing protein [Ignavibacteriales bacterium]MCF8437952.1 flippase-like domain-containing protein [Ignavibacteriales bacterium]
MTKRNLISSFLTLIGFAALFWLLYEFGFQKIIINIQTTGIYVFPILLLWLIIFFIITYIWYIILDDDGNSISYYELFKINVSALAINDITPGINLGGEPYKILSLKDIISTSKAVSSVTLYTMIHWLSHFVVWILAILLVSTTSEMPSLVKSIMTVTVIILLLFTWLFIKRHQKGVFVSLLDIFQNLPLLWRLAAKFESHREKLHLIDDEIKGLFHERPKVFYTALMLDFLTRCLSSFEIFIILFSIGFDISLLQAFYIYAGYTLIVNIIFFMPMQLGTREAGMVIVFEILKITSATGIYVSLIMRIREFFWILIGLLLLRHNKKNIFRRMIKKNGEETNI